MSEIVVKSLHSYPVKSLQGIDLTQAVLGMRGLEYDRHWMIVKENGVFISQRDFPQMAAVHVELTEDTLVLGTDGMQDLHVPLAVSAHPLVPVEVQGDSLDAAFEGPDAAQWITEALSSPAPLRLVRYADRLRPVEPYFLDGMDFDTEFSDGYPYLITSIESLAELNRWLKADGHTPVAMDRFRANIVLEGLDQAFGEDTIARLESDSGEVELLLPKPSGRCVVTAVDQQTGIKPEPKQPLGTLIRFRAAKIWNGKKQKDEIKAPFGENVVLLKGAGKTLSVGQKLIQTATKDGPRFISRSTS